MKKAFTNLLVVFMMLFSASYVSAENESLSLKFNPELGEYVEMVSQVTIDFPDYVKVVPNYEKYGNDIYDPKKGPVKVYFGTTEVASGAFQLLPFPGSTAVLTLSQTVFANSVYDDSSETPDVVFEDGNYIVNFPSGVLLLTDTNGNISENPEFDYNFNLASEKEKGTSIYDVYISGNFENTTEIYDEISVVKLAFTPSPKSIIVNDDCTEPISLVDRNSGEIVAEFDDVSVSGVLASISFTTPFNTRGEYKIVVPERKFMVDEFWYNSESECNVSVNGMVLNPVLLVNPENGITLEELSAVRLSYSYVSSLTYNLDMEDAELTKIEFKDDDGNIIKATMTRDPQADFVLLISPVETITDSGLWTLTIPAGIITINNSLKNDEMVYSWTIDNVINSVKDMKGDDELIDVFTPSGICVARRVESSDLTKLPVGLYIVAGQKIVIR
jgi:hypothetical protein